ncbi:MAG TPA: 50S ribosomal protein L23 [bacterium]|nr:50S ribosomal protein L23 [Dictyoglomota bacterium]HHV80978.1 50S ribosomal protein L23 [bacterium]HOK29565.1 50S ribosomal protein L23 [bacterium]HOL54842.1 50S ribosomal protein L23 [bacterium]HON72293.1 50S ribosomal protein L23 [bacterium]
MADSRDIIIRPVISEKTTLLRLSRKYEFVVSPFANKIEIKRAVEDIFDVKVEKVNIVNKKGKEKRMGMYVGKTPAYKRALVTLAEGHSISFFEGL